MFIVIRIAMTLIPYLSVFVVGNLLTKELMRPSLLSLGLNIVITIYFFNRGLIHKDPVSFIIGSLLTSLILVLLDFNFGAKLFLKKQ
ncbi:MAG: hypothetical protein ACJAWV_003307 [Flammeovirgaceae bacterium]|jgi:hypothetical protein